MEALAAGLVVGLLLLLVALVAFVLTMSCQILRIIRGCMAKFLLFDTL
jgi:hypothetical protein